MTLAQRVDFRLLLAEPLQRLLLAVNRRPRIVRTAFEVALCLAEFFGINAGFSKGGALALHRTQQAVIALLQLAHAVLRLLQHPRLRGGGPVGGAELRRQLRRLFARALQVIGGDGKLRAGFTESVDARGLRV